MNAKRKIAMVMNHVHMDDEDEQDVLFWQKRTPSERLAEVFRLRQTYYTSANSFFPCHIEKIISFRELTQDDV